MITTHSHACDASAAVELDAEYFAAANDEDNILRVYRTGQTAGPVTELDVNEFLGAPKDKDDGRCKECDIEGGTRLGDMLFWITSHGRSSKLKNGKTVEKPERQRLFATRLVKKDGGPSLEPYGVPYRELLAALIQEKDLEKFGLMAASKRIPEGVDGLNIEALCATLDGDLLIGFRNPIPKGKALLVRLRDPVGLMKSGKGNARLTGQLLDLEGRGFRDLVRWRGGYLILAGNFDSTKNFALFSWKGDETPPKRLATDLSTINPESLIVFSQDDLRALVLSDDGDLLLGVQREENKKLPVPERTFRSIWVKLE